MRSKEYDQFLDSIGAADQKKAGVNIGCLGMLAIVTFSGLLAVGRGNVVVAGIMTAVFIGAYLISRGRDSGS